jgi:class 3 adenylate cyclase
VTVPQPAGGNRVLEDFLRLAQQRGEASVATARMVACLAFLVMHLPARLHLLAAGEAKSWILIVSLVVGIGFSVLGLLWSRAGTVSQLRLDVSIAVDAMVVYVTLGAAVVWPHVQYAGVIREPELAAVYLATIGAGTRLSRRGVLLGAALHGLGLAGLLFLDRNNAAIVTYSTTEMVIVIAVFAVAALMGHSVASRTRELVIQGASAAVLAERARQRLGVYVSEAVASTAMNSRELSLGGSNKRAAVLFSDLRGFTRYAERLPPERLVEELNAYLHDMVAEIRAEGGVVDKYIGDAIMAVFGVPSEHPDDAARAIRAADRMRGALVRHNADRKARGLPPLAHGVGVHYGSMVAGNIGTAERMQYTVIGDAVNLASRLETATKDVAVELLISDATVQAALASGVTLPLLKVHGPIHVRGHEAPVVVHTSAG